MHETADELAALQALLDRSIKGSGQHLRSIIEEGSRTLRRYPAVSASYVDGERFALFTHGDAEFLEPGQLEFAMVDEHLTAHYGSSPSTWGPSIDYVRIAPRWSVAYAFDLSGL